MRSGFPDRVLFGIMIEVPSILMELDAAMQRVDFVSVGSNDLLQFLYAADRSNPLVAGRYDPLSIAALRALLLVREAADRHNIPVTLCGEFAAQPLQALALVAAGLSVFIGGASGNRARQADDPVCGPEPLSRSF